MHRFLWNELAGFAGCSSRATWVMIYESAFFKGLIPFRVSGSRPFHMWCGLGLVRSEAFGRLRGSPCTRTGATCEECWETARSMIMTVTIYTSPCAKRWISDVLNIRSGLLKLSPITAGSKTPSLLWTNIRVHRIRSRASKFSINKTLLMQAYVMIAIWRTSSTRSYALKMSDNISF